jgi:ribosome-associated protein
MKLRERGLDQEFSFQTARSGGKGGQNVNKVETKVEVYFNPTTSEYLSEEEKGTIVKKLKSKINSEGFIIINSQKSRSQLANKEDAVKKLFNFLEKALEKPKPRKPTKIPASVVAKRLSTKKIRSEVKRNRRIQE